MKIKILIVEHDEPAAAHLAERLQHLGYAVCGVVAGARRAIDAAAANPPDLALIDIGLAGEVTGPELAERIGSRCDVPVVFLVDGADDGGGDDAGGGDAGEGDRWRQAAASDPAGYLVRPFAARQLRLTIDTAVARYARERAQRASEVTLRQEVERLQNLTSLLKAVLDSMSEGVAAVDADRALLFGNASALRLWLGRDDPPDQRIETWHEQHDMFHADGTPLFPADDDALARALSGTGTDAVEVFIRRKEASQGVHISVDLRPLTADAGVVQGAVIVFRDVTELKRAQAELERTVVRHREQAQLMETIFSSISDGVMVADPDGRFTLCSPSAEQILGVGMLDLKTEQWSEAYGCFHADGKTLIPTDQLPLVRAIRGESSDEVEMFIRNDRRPDGVFISVSGRPLNGQGGADTGGVIVFRDVTRQKQADAELAQTMAELRQQNELMDAAFKSISDGIVVANANGEFLYVNPAAEQIVGMGATEGPQEEWDKTYGTYYPDRETPMATDKLPLVRAIHGGESVDEEDVFIRNRNRPNGVYIRVSARPLLNDIGGIRGGVIIFRDVTEHVLAEEALALAFAEGRSAVVETILHNIGNAVTSVTTGIETVRQSLVHDRFGRRLGALAAALAEHRDDWLDYLDNDPQGRQALPFIIELAADFAQRKEQLIKTVSRVRDRANHIADIVRTQEALGPAGTDYKDVNLREALAGAVRVLRDSLAKRRIRTSIDCRHAPREIRIRESQFHQMLVNLIKNGFEAIDELAAAQGGVRAPRIRLTAYADDRFLILEVADNGIGIRAKDARVLFSPGYTTKRSGSGLGLHSAANFAIATGGRIQPLSEGAGRGTTMRILLPLSSVTVRAADAAADGGAP